MAMPAAIGRIAEVESRVETDEDNEAPFDADRAALTRAEWGAIATSLAKSRSELRALLDTLAEDESGSKRSGMSSTNAMCSISTRTVRSEPGWQAGGLPLMDSRP